MRLFLLVLAMLTCGAAPLQAHDSVRQFDLEADWQTHQAENLLRWIARADDEAIAIPPQTTSSLQSAIEAGAGEQLNQAANSAALRLLLAYRGKCCGTALPRNWHIRQSVSEAELRAKIAVAVEANQVDMMIRLARPSHPHYRALAKAYSHETGAARRSSLALNLARWRSLPLPANGRYLIVNAAAQQLTLWEDDEQMDLWRVIVGKTYSPTPVFSAEVSGVVLNPWWNIPASIAAEGIGAFVRRNPKAARARGYIYSNGRYRQMPGDNNALGRMKLVMPNRFTVFLHDTSNRELFEREDRLLSHGCVRVDRALNFAQTLLTVEGWSQEDVDGAVVVGKNMTVPLSANVPLFIAYFTAVPDDLSTVRFLPDVYRRDGAAALRLSAASVVESECQLG